MFLLCGTLYASRSGKPADYGFLHQLTFTSVFAVHCEHMTKNTHYKTS